MQRLSCHRRLYESRRCIFYSQVGFKRPTDWKL